MHQDVRHWGHIDAYARSVPLYFLLRGCLTGVGDGSFMVKLWRLLSQNYQGLASLDPPITYSRASLDVTHLEGRKPEELEALFPQLLARNPKLPPPTERVTLFFTDAQLAALRVALQQSYDDPINATLSDPASLKLSIQDCVTALVAVACSHVMVQMGEQPITTISNVLNVCIGIYFSLTMPLIRIAGTRRNLAHI